MSNEIKNTSKGNSKKTGWFITLITVVTIIIIVINVLATYTMLQLSVAAGQRVAFDINEWVQLMVPIAGSAVLIIFTFLGVDRLKDFDERQDKLEKSLKEEQAERLENAINAINPKIEASHQAFQKKFDEDSEKMLEPLSSAEKRLNYIEGKLRSYEQLKEDVSIIDIGTVSEAHDYITEKYSDTHQENAERLSRKNTISLLVERVKTGEISGDNNDFHSLAAELARHDYFTYATDVVKKGLEMFGGDIDLLGDCIYYAFKAGRLEEVKKEQEDLLAIGRKHWNWRAFTFFIDVLNAQEVSDQNFGKLQELVKAYQTNLPKEERAWMAAYETYLKYGEKEQAKQELEYADKELAMTAQCSLALAKIYHMEGEYSSAIKSATKAILSQAETQPSSNTGAAFAQRAFSKDAYIHSEIAKGCDLKDYQDEIKSCISDFRKAIEFGYRFSNLQIRIKILQGYLDSGSNSEAEVDYENLKERVDKVERILAVIMSAIKDE